MKSGFRAATVLFCMLFLASAAHASLLLVQDSAGSACARTVTKAAAFGEHRGLQPVSPDILRQRVARLSPETLLQQQNVESIDMQLFHNLHVKALAKDEQRGPNGFLLWTGDIEGAQGGKVVLVVRDGIIFASVYLPGSIIQIRPVEMAAGEEHNNSAGSLQQVQDTDDSQDYIVRQLAYPSRTGDMAQGSGSESAAKTLVELVNIERKADGLAALKYSGELTEAAHRHAMDMASHDIFSHQLSNGEKFWQNVFHSGYPVCMVGENLAAGVSTPEEALECLLSSPGHRANIMNAGFTQTGVSDAVNTATAYRYFWAEEFGSASPKSGQTMRLSANLPSAEYN